MIDKIKQLEKTHFELTGHYIHIEDVKYWHEKTVQRFVHDVNEVLHDVKIEYKRELLIDFLKEIVSGEIFSEQFRERASELLKSINGL